VANVSASIGIAVSLPDATDDADTLLRWADLAMYQAKLAGKGCWRLFDRELRDRVDARRALEIDLRAALPSQLEVRYAPVFHLVTGAPEAFDAVACWHHPRRGELGPTGYADVAHDAGLDVELERWVLGEAAAHAARQQAAGDPARPVWVTVSSRNLRRGDFAEYVAQVVERSGLAPDRLGVSVPQHALSRHAKQVAVSLQWLTMIGVRTAIHEFGLEPFSIPLLQDLHVESVVLHPDLLEHLGDDDRALVGIAAIAGVARALGMGVTAAGVSDAHQAALLQSVGCRAAGGPLFAARAAASAASAASAAPASDRPLVLG
jgi:predicted signal transduction protein with EAL and GGDEF domain